jgi:hypothetical protein
VLDIAAGHGPYGIEVAEANTHEAGVADRYRIVAGNALELDWGGDFDQILLPNVLRHFEVRHVHVAAAQSQSKSGPGVHALGVEFASNEDRISPEIPAMSAFWMLATTRGGDAYTTSDLDQMARKAGFRRATTSSLSPALESLIR